MKHERAEWDLPDALTLVRKYKSLAFGTELPLSVAFGFVAFVAFPTGEHDDVLLGVLYAELQAAAGLLGIVLAALAVVVAFLGDSYIAFLTQSKAPQTEPDFEEIHRLVFVFWFTCVAAVLAVFAALASTWLVARDTDRHLVAGFSTFFFAWALLASLGLVRFVAQHLLFRAAHAEMERRSREMRTP